MEPKPQGHGYCELKVTRKNPFFAINRKMHGHEFHYSKIIRGNENVDYAFALDRGTGSHNKQDGIIFNNILAGYVHLHALGIPEWGPALTKAAVQFRKTNMYRETQVSFSP
jgi:cobyrinic acid a,c-diamide synthase